VEALKRNATLAAALLLAASALVAAQPPPPALTTTVNDFANVIDANSRAELDRRIRALQRASGDIVVVATVPTFQPYGSIEEYAVKMFENGGRGIGEKGKDNGVLIVVAVNDRKVRIESGYDMEQFITDSFAGQTIREAITPEFRSGAYGRGLVAGATRVINRIATGRGVTLTDVPRDQPQRDERRGIPISAFPCWPIIVVWIISMIFFRNRPRRRRRWGGRGWNSGIGPFGGGFGGGGFGGGFGGFSGGGGGGGGGFGGFGGGSSGGGGASGSW
jgi:uncharacterized protein